MGLADLRVAEQRVRAVLEVLDGRYAADGGLGGLGDRSSRPHACPHQMLAVVEARVVELRRAHPV